MKIEKLVWIPAGTFMMGSPKDEPDRNNDETPHEVKLSGFYMMEHPVTQKQYKEIMEANPSYFKGDNLPVEGVIWYDAIVFCNLLSMAESLTPAYSIDGKTDPDKWGVIPTGKNTKWDAVTIVDGSTGYRLPTEAQWEYACRAGTTTPFNIGDNITTDQANYNGNKPYNGNAKGKYRKKTSEVKSFAPNAWGLYDMHGNVLEWCWDWYGKDYYEKSRDGDPAGPRSGDYRILRGGSWGSNCLNARSAFRSFYYPHNMFSYIGFRLVRPCG